MDDIHKWLESTWETRLLNDVIKSQEQKHGCERFTKTFYHNGFERIFVATHNGYNGYSSGKYCRYKIIMQLNTGITNNDLIVSYTHYIEQYTANGDQCWVYKDTFAKPLDFYFQCTCVNILEIIQNTLKEYKKSCIEHTQLMICTLTFLEFYANTYLNNPQSIERILADDYLVKTILQY
jgi:hypothetical protein